MGKWIRMSIVMLLICIALGTYQWWDFQTQIETKDDSVRMTIDLYEEDQQMTVTIHIENMQQGNYLIKKPNTVEQFKCYRNEKNLCGKINNELTLAQQNNLLIDYIVPIREGQFNLINWLPQIYKNGELLNSPINLTLTSRIGTGLKWYSYKEPVYTKELEYIRYQKWEFENQGPIPLVHISEKYKNYYLNEQINIITAIPIKLNPFEDFLKRDFDIENQIFVIDPNRKEIQQQGVAILNHTEKRKIASALMSTYLLRSVVSNNEASLNLIKVINSYFYSVEAHSQKAYLMVQELRQALSMEEKEKWLQSILDSGQSYHNLADLLDQSLNKLDIKTSFFSQNVLTQSFVPFYEVDERLVFFQNKVNQQEWSGILYRGRSYLPLKQLIDLTGMNIVETSNKELLIKYGANRLRFYPDRNLYIINEQKYQFNADLLVNINNHLYIRTSSASEIFPFTIQMNDQEIRIVK